MTSWAAPEPFWPVRSNLIVWTLSRPLPGKRMGPPPVIFLGLGPVPAEALFLVSPWRDGALCGVPGLPDADGIGVGKGRAAGVAGTGPGISGRRRGPGCANFFVSPRSPAFSFLLGADFRTVPPDPALSRGSPGGHARGNSPRRKGGFIGSGPGQLPSSGPA